MKYFLRPFWLLVVILVAGCGFEGGIENRRQQITAVSQTAELETETQLVKQEFRYAIPEVEEVYLVWGVNGWQPVPEEHRPAGTEIREEVMHTPMLRQGEVFTVSVQVPHDVSVEYGFLLNQPRDGTETRLWDKNPDWPKLEPILQDGIVEIQSKSLLGSSQASPSWADILIPLLVWVGGALALIYIYRLVPEKSEGKAAHVLLFLVVFAGFLIRLTGAYLWNSYQVDSPERLIGDEPHYDGVARNFLQGYGFNWPGRVPIYPLWLAGIYALTDGSYTAVPYAQVFLSTITILLTYLLGSRLLGRLAGLLAAFWVSVSYVLIHQTFHLLSEVLYTPVILMVVLLLWTAVQNPSTRRFLWAGIAIGISNLIRPTLLFFPVILILLLFFQVERGKAFKFWLATLVTSVIVVLPWVAHNYWRFGAIFPLQTSNALLWQGSPEYYHLTHEQGYTYHDIWTQVLYGEDWQAHDPMSVEGDRYWTARALRSIADEPVVYLKFAAEKLLTYWVGDPGADWGNKPVFSYTGLRLINYSSRDAVHVILARVLPLLVLVSVIVLRKKFWLLLPVYFLLAYFSLLHALTHAEARLSEPLQPLLLILIAGAVTVVFQVAPSFQGKLAGVLSFRWQKNA